MGHYASEMGVNIPYDPYSESAIEARKKDSERNARISKEITESLQYIGKKWWKEESNDLS